MNPDGFDRYGRVEPEESWSDSSFVIDVTRSGIMAGWRQAVELAMTNEEIAQLTSVSRSRTEQASRVERARMLLAYRENPSFFAVRDGSERI